MSLQIFLCSFVLLFIASFCSGQPPIIFVSDTQKPMWIEDVFLKSHNNAVATELIFGSIESVKPKTVFILGDVVSLGHKAKKWKKIDGYIQSLRNNGTEVNGLLGNHDVMGKAKKGEHQFQKRFANHNRLGYTAVTDSVAVVMLNSNFKTLTEEEQQQQKKWLEQELNELDDSPAVRFVVLACHHAPFTNSKIVRPSGQVQLQFVPAYLKSTKAILFITGHSHNFERFIKAGKNFLVIGGGGGIHQPTRPSSAETNDIAKEYKPLFHYIVMRRKARALEFSSVALSDDFQAFKTDYRFELP
ncbi:MAG: metallophosphoesterase family protein [Flammeovirgaceae bacterium]